ncbi:amidophosphoribosyltransferase [Hyphobacterium sp.]|jgi:amidophosphoribosyltransferase|uniref:amidophosphoribosyltransferase n=1 Tax=Hyphobacterium sp. TaxID=2004662 RepID=UPI003BAB8BC9
MRFPAPPLPYDPGSDHLREECGVFAVHGAEDSALMIALGLHALQHRGQESCGIVTHDGARVYAERHMGLVGEHFAEGDTHKRLPGKIGIGHVRYSTSGATVVRNIQPLYADVRGGGIAVAHNGNLTNARTLRDELVSSGAIFQSTSDTEVILQIAARSARTSSTKRFLSALKQIEGAFALVALVNGKLVVARDPFGIRPLVLGELDGATIVASETCALDVIGASYVRDVEPGEAIIVSDEGMKSERFAPTRTARTCAFEYIYFARPDSVISGISVYEARKRMGAQLYKDAPAEIDVVIPVPDSGVPAALGYAQAAGVPYEMGIIRGHYVGRTFIQPTQAKRDLGVRRKHSANPPVIKGKRVLLVDDSIVRGTTSRKIVEMMREAGATEVHFRSACPPIKFPDFYGIDMPSRTELMASSQECEDMARALKADSLGFLSLDGLYEAVLGAPRNDKAPQLADHYFTGEYTTRLLDHERAASDKDRQLSLLVDA